jgi:arylsulfatase A-like enzyme
VSLHLLALLAACSREPPAPVAPAATPTVAQPPDLVLVGIAGARADPAGGALQAFLTAAGTPRTFANAYAQSTSPFVSLGSLLTGRYPSAIPLCGLPWAPGAEPRDGPWCTHLPEGVPTLPQVLALYGYRTGLVTVNVQGADRLAPLFGEAHDLGEHWADVHTDWSAVTQAASAFWTADTTHPRLLVVATGEMLVCNRPDLRASMGLTSVDAATVSKLDKKNVRKLYADALGVTGHSIAALGAALPTADRPRYTVVFGTNGTNLGDSGEKAHVLRDTVWHDLVLDRTIHVPLGIDGPVPPGTADTLVELVDLMPTLTTLAGAVVPAGLPGRDLFAPGTEADPTAYAEFGDMLAVRSGTRLLSVRAWFFNRSSLDPELTNFVRTFKPDAHSWYLNDLAQDPYQENNLVATQTDVARRMAAKLLAIRTGPGAPAPDAMDARKVWDLRMSPADGYW